MSWSDMALMNECFISRDTMHPVEYLFCSYTDIITLHMSALMLITQQWYFNLEGLHQWV